MIAHLVRRGGQVRRAADRQPRHRAPRRRAAAAGAAAQPLRLLPGHLGGLEQDRARACSTGRTASPPRWSWRTAPRGCWSRRAERRAATRSTSRTTSCTTPTTSSACSSSTWRPTPRSPTGGTSCASSSSRPASPTSRTARGRRRAPSSTSTASWRRRRDLPVTIPLDIGITEGLTCGRDDGSTVTDRLPGRRSPSPAALEKVVVDVSGELIEDHDARAALDDGAPVGDWRATDRLSAAIA